MSEIEETLAFHMKAVGIGFEREFQFHPARKWRADFKIGPKLLVEVEGAKRGNPGRHQRIDGIDADCEKYAEAMLMGYDVLRVSGRMVRDGRALNFIERYLTPETAALVTAKGNTTSAHTVPILNGPAYYREVVNDGG